MGSWKAYVWGLRLWEGHLSTKSSRKPLEDLKQEGRMGNVGRWDEKLTLVFHMAYMENRWKGLRVNPAGSGQSTK